MILYPSVALLILEVQVCLLPVLIQSLYSVNELWVAVILSLEAICQRTVLDCLGSVYIYGERLVKIICSDAANTDNVLVCACFTGFICYSRIGTSQSRFGLTVEVERKGRLRLERERSAAEGHSLGQVVYSAFVLGDLDIYLVGIFVSLAPYCVKW